MNKKFKIAVVVLVAVLATLSLVAADEAGVITINIFNSPSSQLNTEVSNSTVLGQTNYTNSQAFENITLTNSTLTLNINGQDFTFTSQGGNVVISGPGQSVQVKPNLLYVAYLGSEMTTHAIISGGNVTEYDFNITVTVPTSVNFPFGANVTHSALDKVLFPLASNYDLHTNIENQIIGGSNQTITRVVWVNMQIAGCESKFSLFSHSTLTNDQIESLTTNLYGAIALAMSGTV